MAISKDRRVIFEKIIECSEAHEESFRNMPGRSTEVPMMNSLMDLEERLRRLEEKRV